MEVADKRQVGPFFKEDPVMSGMPTLLDLQEQLEHRFAQPALLEDALTHPSLSSTKKRVKGEGSAYERLEFLGDRVLGLVVANRLYETYPAANEGELAKRHAALVSRETLDDVARHLKLDQHLRLTRGPEDKAPRQNLAAMADAMEAVIGALFLDGGLAPAERFIKKEWDPRLHIKATPADPKTALQEWAQGKGKPLPFYRVAKQSGPAHAPLFVIEVSVEGFPAVQRQGESKRQAEKAAATALLEEIEKA